MDKTSNIANELREISPLLADMLKENVYSVAPAYFPNLSEEIIKKINSGEDREYSFSPVIPYKVHKGYFENFSGNILQKIKDSSGHLNDVIDELNEVAPLLNTISKASVYRVPTGYFESLQVSVKPQTKIVSFSTKVTRYVAAAVITGLLAIGSYRLVENNSNTSKDQALNVAVKNLKDEEIIDFLKTTSAGTITSTTFSEKLAPTHEIKQQLKEVTDDELQQYIKENTEPGEIDVDI